MANTTTHPFVSAVSDAGDATLLRPSNWNDGHKYSGGSDRDILVRDTSDATYGGAWSSSKDPKLPAGTEVKLGTGNGVLKPAGVFAVDTTSAQTAANTSETDLVTDSLDANSLSANGKGVKVKAWGTFAANGNTKTVKLYFGATVIATVTGAYNGVAWEVEAIVLRTGATTQEAGGHGLVSGQSPTVTRSAPGETLSGAVTIKATGQNGTAAAGDIVFRGFIIEAIN